MGTWGYKIFEDDASCEWYDDFCSGDQKFEEIEEAIEDVIDIEDFIEHELCCKTLVGAEIICAAYGIASDDFPDEEYHTGEEGMEDLPELNIDDVKFEITSEYIEKAAKAVKKIKRYSKSELRQIWEEADDFDKWEATLDNLIERLNKIKI